MVGGNWITIRSGKAATFVAEGVVDVGVEVDAAGAGAGAGAGDGPPVVGAPGALPASSCGSMNAVILACHSFHFGSGLFDGSCHVTRTARSFPSCSAWIQTPSTVGANQRGFTMIWPTSGM